ncbi:MAG: type II secretion system F family protein [Elusimicrobia bacterium]|nr:type II secretion system F family protein [Elusimicrobiota bacterium]
MPQFKFKAIDAKGATTEGRSGARDAKHLADILLQQGLFLMEAKRVTDEGLAMPAAAPAPAEPSRAALAGALAGAKVSIDAVSVFTTQFTIMVRTALPILETLQCLARQQADPTFRAMIVDVFRAVRAGGTLSAAFSRFPGAFDEVYVSLVAAGEAGGNLPLMLERLSAYINFRRDLRHKVKSAMLYPVIVMVTSVCVVAFLVVFILPTFAEVFAQFDMALPWPTRALLALSAHLRAWWILYVLAGLAAWWQASGRMSDPAWRRRVDGWALDLPVIGPLTRALILTRVLRTLSALVAGGVPILKALDLARRSAGNVVFDGVIAKVYQSAASGQGLASALKLSAYIPDEVSGMVANAERTGSLPETLQKIADFYESEVDSAIRDMLTALEPITVVILGLMVAGIAVAVLLPIFSLGQGI